MHKDEDMSSVITSSPSSEIDVVALSFFVLLKLGNCIKLAWIGALKWPIDIYLRPNG